jgi:hypothetical protein
MLKGIIFRNIPGFKPASIFYSIMMLLISSFFFLNIPVKLYSVVSTDQKEKKIKGIQSNRNIKKKGTGLNTKRNSTNRQKSGVKNPYSIQKDHSTSVKSQTNPKTIQPKSSKKNQIIASDDEKKNKEKSNWGTSATNHRNRIIMEYNEKHVEESYIGHPLTPGSVSGTFQLQQYKKSIENLEKEIAACESQLNTSRSAKVTNSKIKKAKEKYLQEKIDRLQKAKQEESARSEEKRSVILKEYERYVEQSETPTWVEKIEQSSGHNIWEGEDVQQGTGNVSSYIKSNKIDANNLRQIYKRINEYNKEHVNAPYLIFPRTQRGVSLTYQLLESKELIHHMGKKIQGYQLRLEAVIESKPIPAIKGMQEKFWLDRIKQLEGAKRKEQNRVSKLLSEILTENKKCLHY